MPLWSNSVPEAAIKHGYNLERTPPDRPLKAIAISREMLGCYTHWWKGRTIPCEAPHCPACEENQPARWHCYLACFDPKTRTTFIFETTAQAAKSLEHYFHAHQTLRGCLLVASRPRRRRNAKVEIICSPANLANLNLPEPPDLKKAMSVIWQIPANAIDTTECRDGTPTARLRKEVMDMTRDPADNGNGQPRRPKSKRVNA